MSGENYKLKIEDFINDLNKVLKPSLMGFNKLVGNLDLVIKDSDYEILLEIYFTDKVFKRKRIFYIDKKYHDAKFKLECDNESFLKLAYYSLLTYLVNNSLEEIIKNDKKDEKV